MKKILSILIILLAGQLGMSCIGAQSGVGPSFVYFQQSAAVGTHGTYDSDKYMTAEKCVSSWLGLVAVGDASIKEVAKTKGITQVMNVSYAFKWKQGINQAICVQIRGY